MTRSLYTLPEAAAQLGVSRHTLSLQVRLGKLRAQKVGRDWLVSASEITRYRAQSLGRHQGANGKSETPEMSEKSEPVRKERAPGKSEIRERFGVPRPAPKPSRKSERHRSAK